MDLRSISTISSEVVDRVAKCILLIYRGGSEKEKAESNEFLLNFQKSNESWIISLNLLHFKEVEISFFGLQTLHWKLKAEWSSLSESSQYFIVQEIISKISQFDIFTQERFLIERLSVVNSCSGLRLLITSKNDLIFQHLFQSLSLLKSQSPPLNSIIIGIEIFKHFPEELESLSISTSKREEVLQYLSSQIYSRLIECFLDYLQKYSSSHPLHKTTNDTGNNLHPKQEAETIERIFLCIAAYQDIFPVPIDSSVFQELVFNYLFRFVEDIHFFRSAITPLLSISSKDCSKNSEVSLFLKNFLQSIISLQPLYVSSIQKNQHFIGKKIAEIVTTTISTHTNIFFKTNSTYLISSSSSQPSSLLDGILSTLLNFLLQCTSHPKHKISEITFQAWIEIEMSLRDSLFFSTYRNDIESIFMRVIHALIEKSIYPNFEEQETNCDDEISVYDSEDFESFRKYLTEPLTSLFPVIESRFFKFVSELLTESNRNSRLIEAVFYCMSRVACVYGGKEGKDILNQIIEFSLSLPQQFDDPLFSSTRLLLLGEFGNWKRIDGKLVPNSVLAVLSHLPYFPKPASDSLFKLLDSYPEVLLNYLSEILNSVHNVLPVVQDKEAKPKVVQAITSLISSLTSEKDILKGIQSITQDLIVSLQSNELYRNRTLNFNEIENIEGNLDALLFALRQTRCLQNRNEVSLFLSQIWESTLKHLLILSIGNQDIQESLSSVLEIVVVIGTQKGEMTSIFQQILCSLLETYTQFPESTSYLLSLFGTALKNLPNTEPSASVAWSVIRPISESTFNQLQTGLSNQSERVCYYFDVQMVVLQRFPQILFQPSLFETVIRLSISSLMLQERQSLLSVCKFLKEIMTIDSVSPFYSIISQTLDSLGSDLISSLLTSIANPSHQVLSHLSSILFGFISKNRENPKIQEWLFESVSRLLPPTLSINDQSQLVSLFYKVNNGRRFNAFINDFSRVCTMEQTPDVLMAYMF